ncbi:MAG: membrane protein insertase YidC, partial [Xanthobacteraceae bacterium]|nr:membrane protein insertase YidC [Xanthobacteraceae bacterium]
MNDQKNTILAIVLSAIVLIGWQYFIGLPQMERQRQETLLKQQQAQQTQPPQAAPSQAAPSPPAPARPPGQEYVTTPAEQKSRDAALAASPRIGIETPEIKGSIDLKGGRIDDISLTRYHETVDPGSPAIVLLAPSGSAHPFYAEFGWVGAAGTNVKAPG